MDHESNEFHPNCAACRIPTVKRACKNVDGTGIKGCPSLEAGSVLERANKHYEDPDVLAFARASSIQEAASYGNGQQRTNIKRLRKTRIEEIMNFSRRMSYQKLGLAFCLGLVNEAAALHKLLTTHGFDLVSAVCKSGRTDKAFIGVKDHEKVNPGNPEYMCNPIYQAELLNEAGTEFNILMGLCVGHDSMFFKYANAPCTVFAVKDRVTGHNPMAVIYQLDGYYRDLKEPS